MRKFIALRQRMLALGVTQRDMADDLGLFPLYDQRPDDRQAALDGQRDAGGGRIPGHPGAGFYTYFIEPLREDAHDATGPLRQSRHLRALPVPGLHLERQHRARIPNDWRTRP